MEKLLSPDIGLSVWTIITFLLLVLVLSKTAWKPLITALEEREGRIQAEREAAESARKAAQALKEDLDRELSRIAQRAQEALAQAMQQGHKTRDDILRAAQEEAKALLDKTRRQMEDDKDRLVKELRAQVAELSVLAAEKILRSSIDAAAQKRLLEEFFKEIEKAPRAN